MNSDEIRSPHIDHISWGHMEVAGLGVGKDFKLWPGGGREWNWRETDTHHVPGIQPSDRLLTRAQHQQHPATQNNRLTTVVEQFLDKR